MFDNYISMLERDFVENYRNINLALYPIEKSVATSDI